ncbi:hypothetical protein WNY37_09715 [Henriciella sp. AS95]|uniref:hypothetical protein n=1 Tax=Henriciella sp. AS95 TaxID=3135782 RepID=UPI00317D17CB
MLTGVLGTLILLLIESLFALGIMGMTISQYLTSFDVSNGRLFPIGLLAMALAPLLARFLPRRS